MSNPHRPDLARYLAKARTCEQAGLLHNWSAWRALAREAAHNALDWRQDVRAHA